MYDRENLCVRIVFVLFCKCKEEYCFHVFMFYKLLIHVFFKLRSNDFKQVFSSSHHYNHHHHLLLLPDPPLGGPPFGIIFILNFCDDFKIIICFFFQIFHWVDLRLGSRSGRCPMMDSTRKFFTSMRSFIICFFIIYFDLNALPVCLRYRS